MERSVAQSPGIRVPFLAVAAVLAAAVARAEVPRVYVFKDQDGVFHFSSTPRNGAVPFDLGTPAPGAAPARSRKVSRGSPPPVGAIALGGPQSSPGHYDGLIEEYSSLYGVEPELVKAVIEVESNFDRHAVSPRGARGLMQLMPHTARLYGVRNLLDPRQNIEAGVRHLRDLLDRYGSLRLAIAAYNAGAGAVDRHRGLPPYRETRRYVERVLKTRIEYLRRRDRESEEGA